MTPDPRLLALALAAPLAACASSGGPPAPPAAPPQIALVDTAEGNRLFHGLGGCDDCHGVGGGGTAEGPSLVDHDWKLGDGSYEWLLHMTRHAGWGMRDRDGDPQPMRGPTGLDSTQVRQVATYVWAISRERESSR